MSDLRNQITEFVQRPGYAALKAKQLAKKLGITKKKMPAFEAALEAAEAAGELKIHSSGRIRAKRPAEAYHGIVRKISSGAAFIILHEPKPRQIEGDVFVEAEDLKNAQSGDEVQIKLTRRRRAAGQRCGYVTEIISRATKMFVGTYFEEDDSAWVQIDGKDYAEPVWVGDPGAKGACPGDKVVIEMLRFPALGESGEGVLTRVLGARGEPGVDTQIIINEFGLPEEFPEAVLEEARLEAENFREDDLQGREDLTGLTIVTIDPSDARDFDDAISLERSENGHWLLGVHIADVSHFVQPGTALDAEAQRRGTSVYLPTQVIPMLPEVISNGLASLQEGRVRFTMSAFIEFNPAGIPVSSRFSRSAIRVSRRFAYEQVLPLIRGETTLAGKKEVPVRLRQQLESMLELAMVLRRRRFSKGALELDMPEIKLDLDRQGQVVGAHETEHDASHQMIEEFMLAANVAVATELNDQGLVFLRRIHSDPAPQKMAALAEFTANLGYPLKRSQSRRDLQKLLVAVRGKPEEQAVNYAVLRSLKQAEYSPVDLGHYALAEQNYTHFTSPIRRYPDLTIHRLLEAIVMQHDSGRGTGLEEALRLGKHCSMTERRAERAERELIRLKLLAYFESRLGEQMEAVITGVDRFGFFCRGIEIPAEGLVHISALSQDEYFDYDRVTQSLIARGSGKAYRLGDRVRVEVVRVDVDRRELNFVLVKANRRSGSPRRASGKGTPSGKRGQKKTQTRSRPRRKK